MLDVKKFESGNVTKYVFEYDDICIESVLYQYQDRTVLCISTMCGCPVSCKFCGSGGHFKRNLSDYEIVNQVTAITSEITINKRFQIMFMSMGEPFLNYPNVEQAIKKLHVKFPEAELLISTMAPYLMLNIWDQFLRLSDDIDKVGLQISMHSMDSEERDKLIPYNYKLAIPTILGYALGWSDITRRPVFLNFIVNDQNKDKLIDGIRNRLLGFENQFNLTFSVECPLNKENYKPFDDDIYTYIQSQLPTFNIRMFNPDGQDDIGAGCGQLWYVQDWFKNNESIKK